MLLGVWARLRAIKWRGVLRLIHRDVGYLSVALTLAYALSGLAVNHLDDWNPTYRFTKTAVDVGPLPTESLAAMEAHVVTALALSRADIKGHYQEASGEFRVFLREGAEVRVAASTGHGEHLHLARRPVLFEVNALHLNNLKGVWTYVADAFAVALMVLALSGMLMMKGRAGFWGRGKWFVLAGLAVPVFFVVYVLQ